MPEDSVERMARSLSRYQALVVGGLAFLVVFAVTVMGVMLWTSFRLGQQSHKLEEVADETHNSLCALYDQNIAQNREALLYLKANPQGIVSHSGEIIISAAALQRGIDQRRDTIEALKGAGLSC